MTCGLPRGFWAGAQVQIAAAVAQPVASVQPPFDLYRSSTKPRTDFFPRYPPAISVPADGVIFCYLTPHAHTPNFFQTMFSAQSSMRITRMATGDRKPFFPLGKKKPPQEIIDPIDAHLPSPALLSHQTIPN